MLFTPPVPAISAPPAAAVATVARPSVAQKTLGSARVNGQEYLLVQGLSNWQHAYTPASAATQSVPIDQAAIVPKFGFVPPVPASNQSWTYGTGAYGGLPAGYVCLSGIFSGNEMAAVKYAQRFYADSGYFFGAQCGAQASVWPTSAPVSGALTVWLQPSASALAHLRALVTASPVAPSASPGASGEG